MKYSTCIILIIICLTKHNAYCEITCKLLNDHVIATIGDTVDINVDISNIGNTDIYLNGHTIDLIGNWANIQIINDDYLFSSAPFPFKQGESWEGKVFSVVIGELAFPDTYLTQFFLYGGDSEDADMLLVSGYISITVRPHSIPVDFDSDDDVDLEDFAIFVYYWMDDQCVLDNNFCYGTDTDANGKVEFIDFVNFVSHWLEGTQ